MYNSSIENYCQNLCSKCTPRTRTKAHRRGHYMADSGINDRLVKLRSLIDQTCFEFIDAINFLLQNTPDTIFCAKINTVYYCHNVLNKDYCRTSNNVLFQHDGALAHRSCQCTVAYPRALSQYVPNFRPSL